MSKAQKKRLDALAAAIVANPEKDPRFMIADMCKVDEDFKYLEAKVEELERAAS